MQNLSQFVVDRLRQGYPAAGAHLDADLLTAFAEQALGGVERTLVIEHLARCGDCRDVAAIVSSTVESVTDGAGLSRFGADRRSRWFAWPALQWGALAAALLIVVTAGFVEFRQRGKASLASNLLQHEVVQNSSERAQSVANQTTLPRETQGKNSSDVSPSGSRVVKTPQNWEQPSTANKQIFTDNAIAHASQPSRVASVQPQAQMPRDEAPMPVGQLASNEVPVLPGREVADLEIVKAKNAIPAEVDASSAEASAWMLAQVGLPRWAVNAEGSLLRSFDGGNSWENVNPTEVAVGASDTANLTSPSSSTPIPPSKRMLGDGNSNRRFLALAVDGLDVWVGGSSGRLYHSMDSGDHWDRVIPAEAGAALTGDVIGIQFYDAEHGRVTTSASEVWITADAGQTWLKRQ